MRKILTAVCLALGLAGTAHAEVDITALDDAMAGPRARVLVLGSVHLAELPADEFDPATLEPLLDRLATFDPQVITIEAISGTGCNLMARHPAVYDPESIGRFCSAPDAARAATGLDVPAAIAAVDATLADWPARPTPAQRRRLASLFMAANDDASALVQWLQLPEAGRRAGDGLDDALAARLDALSTRHDESLLIAARLAARLGLQRVFPTDDHTGDSLEVADEDVPAFGRAIQRAWARGAERMKPLQEKEQALLARGDMLGLYRHINRSDRLASKIESDFGAALRDDSPQHFGQLYVAGWETRNLRMVANIREAFRERPGARVLSVVGATHKPWFDSLLGQMQGVDIVDVQDVLGSAAD